jgi:hypothetical protein
MARIFPTRNSAWTFPDFGTKATIHCGTAATAPDRQQRTRQPTSPQADPFHNLRERREKKKQSEFEYDLFSINKNLID